jgi:hypothetical protein
MWHIYTIKYYSATKKNEIMSFADMWIELKIIMLNEVSQVQKEKRQRFHVFTHMCKLGTKDKCTHNY